MLNSKITCSSEEINKNLFNKICSTKFYDMFLNYDLNKHVAYLNSENQITLNFKILMNNNRFKKEFANGYMKLYYDNVTINKIVEYNAFYPETFYYVWEIFNNFNIINSKMNKFLIIDDNEISKGHLEALMKYCENNFRYENNEYIRIPLYKSKLTYQDKKFISVYCNHKVYDFGNYDNNMYLKIHQYFKDNKFDFVIATSKDLIKNIISLVAIKQHGNAIFYIDDFINQSNDNIISIISVLFENVYVYKSDIQDALDVSCWIILMNYNCDKNILDVIKMNYNCDKNVHKVNKVNNINNTNIEKIRNDYTLKYIDELLNLYSHTKINDNNDNNYNNDNNDNNDITQNYNTIANIDKSITWAQKNNLIVKNTNNKPILDENNEYVMYNFDCINHDYDLNKVCIDYHTIKNDQLHTIKRNLNKYKRLIDTKEQCVYNNYDKDIIDWAKLTNCIDLYKNLKKIVMWKCNAEVVNNTWLKIYEIIKNENLIDHNSTKFKSFHLCETTGSSIFALNHYIKTQTNIKLFDWRAQCQSYNDNFIGKYDLWDMFPEKWLLNNDGCAYLENINTINNYVNSKCLQNIDLIICDGNIKTPPNKFNEQEGYSSYAIYTQIYTMLHILPQNGNTIIKMFVPLAESMTISILYLLYNFFDKVSLTKPASSHPASSEIYCVCKTYRGFHSIPNNIKNKLHKLYVNYDVNNSIFPTETINEIFVDKMVKFSKLLSEKQIDSIKRSLYLRNIYYYDYDIQNELSIQKEESVNKWILINNVKQIKQNDKIVNFRA